MSKPIPQNPTADLPTTWTRGQTVAPVGTDVGLTLQHGYNYLMQKVNESLTDIGTLNDNAEQLASDIEDCEEDLAALGFSVVSGQLCAVYTES